MRSRVYISFVCLCCCLLVAACDSTATSSAPTQLRVTRQAVQLPPFHERTITDARKVQQFYDFLFTLPAESSQEQCGYNDMGITYFLRFYQKTALLQEVRVQIDACRTVVFATTDTEEDNVRLQTDEFWTRFSQITGLSTHQLFQT